MKIKISQADRLFSKYIRTRDNWQCQRCKRIYPENSQGLHCSHYFGRGRWATRFHPDNCIALCFGCHRLWDGDEREFYKKFKIKQLGEKRLQALEVLSHSYAKRDEKLALMYVKELIKTL